MCTRYLIINRVSELKVHIKLTRFVQPEKIEIDANERAVNEKSPYCFFVCTTFDSFLNDYRRKGIAKELLSRVVNDAREYGCGTVQITASDMGVKLYTDFGFVHNDNFMQYKI